jgi:uncharacterized protein YfaT (DUF1175 family)
VFHFSYSGLGIRIAITILPPSLAFGPANCSDNRNPTSVEKRAIMVKPRSPGNLSALLMLAVAFFQAAELRPQAAPATRAAGPSLAPDTRTTPAFLLLDSDADRDAFRRWFSAIAEFQALRPAAEIPPEVSDCAALLRYAYRGALRAHTGSWLEETGLAALTFLSPVRKYTYPHTPLGAALFRIRPATGEGSVQSSFAEFADAKSLRQFNTYFVSRDVRLALPGDILFFRQLEQNSPYHSMVFVGRSQIAGDGGEGGESILVYHTGPTGKTAGEMRRVKLRQLLQHPSPRWRPVQANTNFLGVYRWNILREVN